MTFADKLTTLDTAIAGFTARRLSRIEKAANDGLAPLVNGTVPVNNLPSFVDDIVDYPNAAAFPAVGESGKIYIDVSKIGVTGAVCQYRWSGSAYQGLVQSPGSSDAIPEGVLNLYFTAARASAAAPVQSVAGLAGSPTAAQIKTALAYTSAEIKTALGYTPVQMGTGTNQSVANVIKIGWGTGTYSGKLALTVDNTDMGTSWPIDISGKAIAAGTSDYVDYMGVTGRPTRTNWQTRGQVSFVAGVLGWRNKPNAGIIFDASGTVNPDGGAINSNVNPDVQWAQTYPTLMGWDGTQTYGVRVDVARYAETANNSTSAGTAFALDGTRNYSMKSLGVGVAASGENGEIRAAGDITGFYSDERLKEVTGKIEDATSKLLTLNTIIYHGNALAGEFGFDQLKQQVGLKAHEVQLIQPEAVAPAPFDIKKNEDGSEESASGENYLTVKYERLVPLLIQGFQEQQAVIEELKLKIKRLESVGVKY